MGPPRRRDDPDEREERDTEPPAPIYPEEISAEDIELLDDDDGPELTPGPVMPPEEVAAAERIEIEEEVELALEKTFSKIIMPDPPPPDEDPEDAFYKKFEKT